MRRGMWRCLRRRDSCKARKRRKRSRKQESFALTFQKTLPVFGSRSRGVQFNRRKLETSGKAVQKIDNLLISDTHWAGGPLPAFLQARPVHAEESTPDVACASGSFEAGLQNGLLLLLSGPARHSVWLHLGCNH